jgi:hypothetical protein
MKLGYSYLSEVLVWNASQLFGGTKMAQNKKNSSFLLQI